MQVRIGDTGSSACCMAFINEIVLLSLIAGLNVQVRIGDTGSSACCMAFINEMLLLQVALWA